MQGGNGDRLILLILIEHGAALAKHCCKRCGGWGVKVLRTRNSCECGRENKERNYFSSPFLPSPLQFLSPDENNIGIRS